jgi:hypothetical protein
MWLADKTKEAGMKPVGDKGTFFPFFDIYRTSWKIAHKAKRPKVIYNFTLER